MAEDYLTDDEQLEHVKRLAAEYGPWTIGAVVLGLAFVTGYRYYQGHQDQRALAAGAQFEGMAVGGSAQRSSGKARQIADGLVKDFPGTPYADQAQLALAGLYVDQGEDANAIAPLTAVMEHSKDAELRRVARLRLARVMIDQGKPTMRSTCCRPSGPGTVRRALSRRARRCLLRQERSAEGGRGVQGRPGRGERRRGHGRGAA